MGFINNPSPQSAFAANGNDPLYLGGSSTGGAMGSTNYVCAGNLQRYPSSGLPAWVQAVTNPGPQSGVIQGKVGGALIRFEIEVRLTSVSSGTFASMQVQATTTGSGTPGGNVFANEPAAKVQGVVGQTAGIFLYTWLYQFQSGNPPTETVYWFYVVNPSVAGNANTYSQLKAYRIA